MAGTSTVHAAYARESRVDVGGNDVQDQLFSLPTGEPATFLFHNFENADLTKRIFEHGGRVTDDDDDADVILTISREEYISLKDKYAISRKTHVRLSGFVDRCINAHRFQLAPIVEKGVPGRKLVSRRTEFTKDDDEHLCQYIAEVLPDKGEAGRTGHFIYTDLTRRADEFGQYKWAYRHPKDGWRERYRKNRDRMDERIAQIVENNPPPPDGKGRYMYRRYGKIDEDDELKADDDGLVEMDEEERRDSATDNEDSPVQIKRNAQRQEEEEEEEEDGEGQAVMHRPEASSNLRSQGAKRQEAEITEEQAGEQQPEVGRTRSTRRRSRVSLGDALGPKRRRTRASQTALEEPRIPDDLDATLRGDTELDYDKPAEEPVPSPPPSNEAEIGKGKEKRSEVRARRVVPPLSPRRTRTRSRLLSIQPEAVPAASRTTSRAKAKAKATAATAAPKPVPESQVFDEFVAHSDNDDEGEMHEVEANLQITAHSRESPAGNQMHSGHRAEDLQTSRRVQSTAPSDAAIANPASDDLDDDDDDDIKLFAFVKKLDIHAPPVPAANQNRSGHRDRDQRSSSEEIFPSPRTRAGAEKRRLTQAAKAAPYVPPKGTRAASMIEKERARSRKSRADDPN